MNRSQRRQQNKQSKTPSGSSPNQLEFQIVTGSSPAATTNPLALLQQALTHHQGGQLPAAVATYRQLLSLQPHNMTALCNLGAALKNLGKLKEAADCFQQALTIQPDQVLVLSNLGLTLQDMGRLDEAIRCFQQALTLDPKQPAIHTNLGLALATQGEMKAAIASQQKALTIAPGFPQAHFSLSQAQKILPEDPRLDQMAALVNQEKTIEGRVYLHFALGKSLADLGRHDEAFRHYLAGNRLQRSRFQFNLRQRKKSFHRYRAQLDQTFFAARQGWGIDDPTPIFIVGLPRSGTTLAEQILASHPDVYGAGELPFIKQILMAKTGAADLGEIPLKIPALNAMDFQQMGRDYLDRLRKQAATAAPLPRFISDKMPFNFIYIGLIRLMLPQARFIHCQRSPRDTCLSIFFAHFSEIHPFAYDLTELGGYYRLYREMMAHWHQLFPGKIHNLSYEKLTRDQEGETRRLLDFCGLNWQENCLHFHNTARSVKTASQVQVRKPLYRSSLQRWRCYEAGLQPLISALGNAPEPD
ncbi:MAG: sulfotransferase [Magnetococcales bacterium]|nr:sulfotransferase [Magnetococcales bacterium]